MEPVTQRPEGDRREHGDIHKRIGALEGKHEDLAIKFAESQGRALFYKIAFSSLQFIIAGVGIGVLLCVMQLKIDVALIKQDQEYIKKAVGKTKNVSMYNQRILKGDTHAR